MMVNKQCCHCHEIKPVDDFGHNRSKKNGHQEYCLSCAKYYRSYWRRYPNHDPEAVKLYRASPQNKYYQIKYRATQDGIPITFTRSEFVTWFENQDKICFYCKTSLNPFLHHKLNGLTIDRRDNDKGYALDNIALSCVRCNMIKGSWFTEKQMLEIAEKYLALT